MSWTDLGTQFCLTLAFGLLLGLATIPRAPLGVFFFRMMGTTAALPLAAAALGATQLEGRPWRDPVVLAALCALAAFPFVQAPVRAQRRALALWWSVVCSGVALAIQVQRAPAIEGPLELALASSSVMATGAVAGGVGLAMVVGHWYLTVPQLPVAWLVRLNKLTIGAMAASVALLGASLLVHGQALQEADTPLFGPWGLFYLGARVSVGLALPLVFAWMTAGSLKYENTRSATGILYASTVLVLIGTAVSISLQDSYGVPL